MTESPNPDEMLDVPDLSLPPHVLPQLFEWLAEGSLPDPDQQDTIMAHLFTCSWCRVTLLYLLSVAEEADRRTGEDTAPAHALLQHWANLHQQLEAKAAEDAHTGSDAAVGPHEGEESEER